jgi:ABC-type nitrate/sulfonate/bicarbonate transport system substrate-binding protein
MPALITSQKLIDSNPDAVAAAVRALVKTQEALKADVKLATRVGQKYFPAAEAELIADVVERDLPFYDASISPEFVKGMVEFQRNMGLLDADVAYEDVVATQFSKYWKP